MLEYLPTSFSILLLIVCIALFDRFKRFYLRENLFKKIGWIAEKGNRMMYYGPSIDLRDEELIYYILQQQQKLNIPEEYRLDYSSEIEKRDAEEILNLHKNEIIKAYFSNFITPGKTLCKLNSLEYYMCLLHSFLIEKIEDDCEYRYKVYKYKETKNSFRYHNLTDFGRTHHKLYLIVTMYCQQNEKTKPLIASIHTDGIIERLKNNEVVL